MKLSPNQIRTMAALSEKPWRGAFPGLSLGTLNSLEKRGLVRSAHGIGSMAFPHTSIKWTLTDAGREAWLEAVGRCD